jgi:hypothetical protein
MAQGIVSPSDAYLWQILQYWFFSPKGGFLLIAGLLVARRSWVAGRTLALLMGGLATAASVLWYDVYVRGDLGPALNSRIPDAILSEPATAFGLGMFVAAEILVVSAYAFVLVLAIVRGAGFKESNIRSWPVSFGAGVLTVVGDRALNGPFEDWPASLQSLWGAMAPSHPLNWGWILGFPLLGALLILRWRGRQIISPTRRDEDY